MAAPTALTPAEVPGKLCAEDRRVVAQGFNALRETKASPRPSGLRIVDTLDSRFVFTVSNPSNVSVKHLQSLRLKLQSTRSIALDLPRASISVECWRSNWKERRGGGKKRRRPTEGVLQLPSYLEETLAGVQSDTERAAIAAVLLWVLNRDEDFCTFDLEIARDETTNVYTLRLENFESVTCGFLVDLSKHWRSLVKDVIVEWSSQALILCLQF